MRIAICDDDQEELSYLSSIIDTYRQEQCISRTASTPTRDGIQSHIHVIAGFQFAF